MPDHSGKVEKNKDNSLDGKQELAAMNAGQSISVNAEMNQMQALQGAADSSAQVQEAIQLQTIADHYQSSNTAPIQRNKTRLPDSLKYGVENLSGHQMDDVNVHYNSPKPKQFQAHAYAQGTDIYVASGQEKHLPHEAWHVAQQKQNRVKPTKQINGNVNINDDKGLEKEADVMGAKATNVSNNEVVSRKTIANSKNIIQRNPIVNQDSGPAIVNTYGMGEAIADDPRADLTEDQKEEFLKVRESKSMAFKSLNNGSLEGLATALNACPENIVTLKDDDLVAIIQNNFESNWFKAKKCLTTDFWPGVRDEDKPPHGASIQLMQALVDMRGRVWDRFVKRVQPNILAVIRKAQTFEGFENLKNPENLNDNFGLKESVGSESVTSDIDLSAKGENTEMGVMMINTLFNDEYGTEPGAFFDINVYSSDWMFGSTDITNPDDIRNIKKSATSEALKTTGLELNAPNQKRKDHRNEVWSMVKIRRNMRPDEWESYKRTQRELIEDGAEESAATERKFDEVDLEYRSFHNTVERETAKLKATVDHEEERQRSVFVDASGKDHFADEAMEMKASNIQYEKIMLGVKRLRLEIQQLKNENNEGTRAHVEELLLQVHDGIAKGLTYANEVYATEGAVLNTVLGDQGAQKKMNEINEGGDVIDSYTYILTKEQYLQAVNENVGDTLHSINHNSDDPPYAIYRAGKYIARLCNAAGKLVAPDEPSEIRFYSELEEIGSRSVIEKSGRAGTDPMAVHEGDSFFSTFTLAHLNEVKNQAISFGATVAGNYKRTKA